MSIKAKFIVPTTIIIIVTASAILAASIFLFFTYIDFTTEEKVASATEVAIRSIELYKQETNEEALALTQDTGLIDAAAIHDRAALLRLLTPQGNSVGNEFRVVADANGNVLADTNDPDGYGYSIAEQPLFKSAVAGEAVTGLFDGADIRMSIQSGAPLLNGQGKTTGVVIAGVRMDTEQFVDSVQSLVNCEVSIITGGERISTTVTQADGTRAVETMPDAEIMETVLAGRTFSGRADVLNNTAISRYTPLQSPDGNIIGVLFIGQFVRETYGVIYLFMVGALLITMVTLAISITIILAIVGRIVTPIQSMTEAAKALALGDTNLTVDVKTHDEMRTLADAFNSIIQNTKQQIEIVNYIATGDLKPGLSHKSNIELVENIASGSLETTILPRSNKDEMNRVLEKLNMTIRAQSEAIRREHNRIQLLLDANPLACRLWDENYNLIECNEAAVKLFHLESKQEYIDRFFELAPLYQPDGQMSRLTVRLKVKQAFMDGACRYNFECRMPDGSPLPTEVTLVRVPYGNHYVVAAYARDLREQIQMLAEIEQRDSITTTVNRIADVLLQSKPEIFANTLQESMGMMTRAIDADRMFIFKNFEKDGLLLCTQIYEWSENVRSYMDNEITTNIVYDLSAPETRRVLQSGECLHSLVRDLPESDRAQYEDQGILTVMLIPVFIHNDFWGFVGFDNCHAERLFTSGEEAIVRSGSMLIANALLRNDYVKSIHDASAELAIALEEAETANNAKGDFLASMSHEMRTPLNAIIGLSEIAMDDDSLSEDAVSNLEKIYTSGTTLLSIVNDILDVSKIQSGKFEIHPHTYDVPSMINDTVIQNVLRIGSRPIHFVLNLAEDMCAYLMGDELRIKQILNNLLSNAIKYTEEGQVVLTVNHRREGDSVWLNIAIQDSGVGIRQEDLSNLFVDFVQFGTSSKHQAGGTGLGLSITKSLVEMMDGYIDVQSTYGIGSTFTVTLRQGFVDDAVIGPDVAKNISGFQYSSGKMTRQSRSNRIQMPYARVLIVDDNVTNLDVAKGLMRPYGMKVDGVTGGLEAVEAVREEKVKYNAIFMDHMMPVMNGVEATHIIRNEIDTDYARNLPIIALTANAVAGSEEMFLQKGFNGFVSKPIDIKKLDAIINRWVRNKNLEDKYINAYRETKPDAEAQSVWKNVPLEHIDIDGALERFSGDDEILTIILHSYASSTRPLINGLDEYLASGNNEDYTIAVHGIKGTSYSVFAQEVGKTAEELEAISKTGDMETLKTKHEAFKIMAIALLDELDAALKEVDAALKGAPAKTGTASASNQMPERRPTPVKPMAERPEKNRFGFTAPEAKILIVDDNETNLTVALGLLKPLKMIMDTAENGQAALMMLRKTEYDLVFMDHFMPVMDGIEATQRLREMDGDYFRNVPVIALSASISNETREVFMQAGMNDFAGKPIDTKEMKNVLLKWLPKHLVIDPLGDPPASSADAPPPVDAAEEPDIEMPEIEGIDVAEGIRYSGSAALLTGVLGNFYKLIDIKAQKIEKCLADALIRDVTIEVHALKSTARMIGATALSKEFAQMEEYGNAGDIDALNRELPAVLEHYRSYKPILKPYGETAETGKIQAGTSEIIALLRKLQSSINNFDLDGADSALKELDALRMPEGIQQSMETLRAYVADVAMEDIIELTERMIEAVSTENNT